MPKQQQSKLESVKLFFWDPRTKKCMGRTGESWLKIIAFYIALYVILAAVWSLFFYMFQQTISDRYPKWQLDKSLIGTNPGLGFRPQNPPSRIDSALISYRAGQDSDQEHWIKDLNRYFESNSRKNASFKEDCSADRDEDSYCPFDTSSIPPECTAAQNYSFNIGKPCILIKINRVSYLIICLSHILLKTNKIRPHLHLRSMAGSLILTRRSRLTTLKMRPLRRTRFK